MPAFVNTEEHYEDVDCSVLVMKQLQLPPFVVAELTVEFMYYCITTFVFYWCCLCLIGQFGSLALVLVSMWQINNNNN